MTNDRTRISPKVSSPWARPPHPTALHDKNLMKLALSINPVCSVISFETVPAAPELKKKLDVLASFTTAVSPD
jgi:hypothetical protein